MPMSACAASLARILVFLTQQVVVFNQLVRNKDNSVKNFS